MSDENERSGGAADSVSDRPLFSCRVEMARRAAEWCETAGVPATPLNIVTALSALRLLTPTLADAEREAVEWCVEMAMLHATECDDELAALRGLLERTR
jgi:hypothetical protein